MMDHWNRWQAGAWSLAAAATLLVSGCISSSPILNRSSDCCETDGVCCDAEPGSEEWWAAQADLPVGARQKHHRGKLWPPFPRPTEPQQQFSSIYHAAHYWPHPYVCADRAYVRNMFDQQVAKGWINETTLYDFHFEPETGFLNRSGRIQLRWILREAPQERRTLFVQAGEDTEASEARMNVVREEVVTMVGERLMPPILLRQTTPYGRSAEEVERIRQNQLDSMPIPRIGSDSGDAAGGGASEAAAGAADAAAPE